MKDKTVILCECRSPEHQMILEWDFEDKFIYCSIHLNPVGGFWKRLKLALRYLFGYRSRYGHWDEFIFGKEQINVLRKFIDR